MSDLSGRAPPLRARHRNAFAATMLAAGLLAAGFTGANAQQPAGPPAGGPPAAAQPAPVSDELVVTLLGTGTPSLDMRRMGFSNLVQAGGLNLVFDAGRGASLRLDQLGLAIGSVSAVFITHFHSDHVNGLADIYTTGYLAGGIGGRKVPFELYGPKGTQRLADGLRMAHLSDIETRMADEGIADAPTRIAVKEMDEGVIFERNGVKVTMFRVNHGDKIDPAVGYRVDYNGRSVVFSSDTRYSENVVQQGKGADILVHSVGIATDDMAPVGFVRNALAHHSSPEDAGRVFDQAKPGLAVYSHLVRFESVTQKALLSTIVQRTRSVYAGPLVVGEDLMQFRVGAKGTSIYFAQVK